MLIGEALTGGLNILDTFSPAATVPTHRPEALGHPRHIDFTMANGTEEEWEVDVLDESTADSDHRPVRAAWRGREEGKKDRGATGTAGGTTADAPPSKTEAPA